MVRSWRSVVGRIGSRSPRRPSHYCPKCEARARHVRRPLCRRAILAPAGAARALRDQGRQLQTSINALEQDLAEKRRVIVILNAETLWNRPGKRNAANHFVVVAGMEPRAGVVHLNDSGVTNGRDEQVPIATFEQAWAPNRNSAIVTK
jgi:predicted double-glycine peptidase